MRNSENETVSLLLGECQGGTRMWLECVDAASLEPSMLTVYVIPYCLYSRIILFYLKTVILTWTVISD
jgi:hypothetical protein